MGNKQCCSGGGKPDFDIDQQMAGEQYQPVLQAGEQMTGREANVQSGWSAKSLIIFFLGNLAFVAYLAFGIPNFVDYLPAKNVVYGLSVYVLLVGVYQIVTFACTGKGADYGKFVEEKWLSTIPIGISWWTMEQPSFFVPACFLSLYWFQSLGTPVVLMPGEIYLGLFMLHYAQRSFIYPCLTRGNPYPTFFWAIAICFTSINGTLQSLDLLYGGYYQSLDEVWCVRSIIGCVLFLFGMIVNIHSDFVLRHLRVPGETGYKIPRGGMFEYISGANLWGEAVEWTGLAIASRSLGMVSFAVFCWAGIGFRCIATHTWYLNKFGDEYPKQRKNLIPFVW